MTFPTVPTNSVNSGAKDAASETSRKTAFRTQTYTVKGWRKIDHITHYTETRIQAPSKDHAIGIAHQRGIRVAECVPAKT